MSWAWRLALTALAVLAVSCGPDDGSSAGGGPPAAVGADEIALLRGRMVDTIEAEYAGLDPRVLDALRKVPRHRFVPGAPVAMAYDWESPLPIGEGQNISAPEVVAQMTSRLGLRGTEKVLEIGTGSGYQAAVLAEIVPHVFTIEILPRLGEQARRRLAELGYENVRVRVGDGYQGWPEEAPFDAIIVTAAPPETPPRLLEQLAPGGCLLVPEGAGDRVQWLMIHRKDADGVIHKEKGIPVTFVPMIHEGGK